MTATDAASSPSPFVAGVAPITEHDDRISAALQHAELAPLLPALAYLTGDLSLLRADLRPDPLMLGLPFSGSYGFAETEMNWPLNHMVAPKGKSVTCEECHVREGGRLASVGGFYMPGRDRSRLLDGLGTLLLLGSFAGVVVHGGARFWFWP